MKNKVLIFCIVCCICSLKSWSQDIYLNAYGSYVFDNSFDSYYDRNQYYVGDVKGGL